MRKSFFDIVTLARYNKQVFGRTLSSQIYRPPEGILSITKFHDDFHDMTLAVLLDPEALSIKAIDGTMARMPYPTCPHAIERLQVLVGLSIFQKGILKEVSHRYGRAEGCAHFYELLELAIRSLFAEVSSTKFREARGGADLTLEEKRQVAMKHPVLANTCVSFNHRSEDPEVFKVAQEKLEAAK